MLKTMRRITKPIMWLVAIAFVAFLGWEGVVTTKTNPGTVATINGQDISIQVYQAFYDRSYRLAQQELGDTVEFDDYINQRIKEGTWNDIITQILLTQQAKKRGILVTNKEVFEYLRRFPPLEFFQVDAFLTEGKFDYNKYAQALLDTRVDWSPIENYVQERLLIGKVQMMITGLVRVSEADVKDQWVRDNTLLEVRFVRFPVERYFNQIQPQQPELEEFYQKNKERFVKEDRADLYYVEFLKKPQLADDEAVKKRLEDFKARIKSDSDFVALARQHSEDQATKDNGGELGWIEEGSFIPAFDAVLKRLQPNQLSEPIKSSYGWHLLKLWGKRTSAGQEQYQLSHILLIPKLSPEGLKGLKQKATGFAKETQSGDFEKVVKKFDLRLAQTGWFNPGGFIQGFGNNEEVNKFAFNSPVGAVSEVIETPTAFYVIQLKEHRPAGPAGLDEIRTQLVTEYRKSQALEKGFQEAKLLYQLIQKGEGLTQVAKSQNQIVEETGKFKASESLVPNLGNSPEFVKAALSLTFGGKLAAPVRTQMGVFLMELVSKETAPDSQYIAAGDSLYRTALEIKQNQVYTEWFTQLMNKAEIKDYREEFFKEEIAPES